MTIKFNDENCKFAVDLLAALCTVDFELKEYLFNKKWCQKQLTIFCRDLQPLISCVMIIFTLC